MSENQADQTTSQDEEQDQQLLRPAENEDADDAQTPLELVQEQQAMAQQNLEVAQQREEPSPEVPGASIPSAKRHHPQRQMYDSGKNKPGHNVEP